MPRNQNLQIVWPKDGYRGRDKRGFLGGFGDICKGKGPDMFLQTRGSQDSIKPDRWGNWDTYHNRPAHYAENYGKAPAHRGYRRYDPHSRKYVTWGNPHDWQHLGMNDWAGAVPWFTEAERKRIYPGVLKGRLPDPRYMGSEWNYMGPKRWRPEHKWFWNNAHRIGDNIWKNAPITDPAMDLPYYQASRSQLADAVHDEFWQGP